MRRVAVQEGRRVGDEIEKGGNKEVRKREKENERQKQIKEKRKWRKLGCIKGE